MEILLVCIVVLLTLNLLVDVSMWSRQSAVYNRIIFWLKSLG